MLEAIKLKAIRVIFTLIAKQSILYLNVRNILLIKLEEKLILLCADQACNDTWSKKVAYHATLSAQRPTLLSRILQTNQGVHVIVLMHVTPLFFAAFRTTVLPLVTLCQ